MFGDAGDAGDTVTSADGAEGSSQGDDDQDDGGEKGDGDGDGDGDDGSPGDLPRFDVGNGDGDGDGDGRTAESCTGVDLLFVIDNSGSMGRYQDALGVAFPDFVDTLVGSLPASTSLHVGVTSTEMGFSSQGNTSITNGVCTFEGDGGLGPEGFYITPDVTDTGRNGAQGRLYSPPGSTEVFVAFETDDVAGIASAKTWFADAASIGTGGSNIEMLTAPAGWAAHPVNTSTGAVNDGFFRDDGVVTVVFFMQDEPDQTPLMVQGAEAGMQMLQMLADAKPICGGVNCILAGGFLEANACGTRPIDTFLSGLGGAANVASLPPSQGSDAQIAADMNAHLSTVLADVIAQKCDEIPPAG